MFSAQPTTCDVTKETVGNDLYSLRLNTRSRPTYSYLKFVFINYVGETSDSHRREVTDTNWVTRCSSLQRTVRPLAVCTQLGQKSVEFTTKREVMQLKDFGSFFLLE